jgi:tRNA dimethylallyltransferase
VGYKECFALLDGSCTFEEAKEKIFINTRRYAKRQMTWFRRNKDVHWFNAPDIHLILATISPHL